MYKQIVFLILLITVINGETVGWSDCGSNLGIIIEVRIAGCSQAPCTFRRGETYRLEADAISFAYSETLPFTVTGEAYGIGVPIISGNACGYLLNDAKCPVTTNGTFSFGIDYKVPSWYFPVDSGVIKALVYNDKRDKNICAVVPASIQ